MWPLSLLAKKGNDMKTGVVQTGDVIFFPLGFGECLEPVAKKIPSKSKKRKGNVILIGRTGNTHAIKGTGFQIYDSDGKVFLRVTKKVMADHGEHTAKPLSKGDYEIRFVQEHDVFSGLKRAVVD